MRKLSLLSVSLILALAMLLSACGGTTTSTPASTPSSAPASAPASAEEPAEYSFDGTVTLLCDSESGSNEDLLCRALASACQDISGVTFVVENVPGGNSATAVQMLKSTKDTEREMCILMESNSMALSMLQGTNPYKIEDISIVSKISSDWNLVVTTTSSGFKTWDDLVEYAKANPGELNWGGAGAMGATQLGFSLYCLDAGIEANYVAYQGTGNAKVGLVSGDVSVLNGTSANFLNNLREEGTEYVALLCTKPVCDFEGVDIPTCAELGMENANDYSSSRSIYADSAAPAEQIEWLDNIIGQAVETDSFNEFARTNNIIKDYQTTSDAQNWFNGYVEMATDMIPQMK